MAISEFGKKDGYVWNHYRKRRIGNGFLLTTDYGSWVYLTDEELSRFQKNKFDDEVFSLLKERGIILTKGNDEQIVRDYRKKCDYLFQGASLHIVVPTLRCNHKCIYCHAAAKPLNSKGYDMDKKTARKTIEFIFQTPSRAITIEFQGGEPLLRFDLVKYMVEYADELNKTYKKEIQYSLVSNLTNMTDGIFDYLKKRGIGICTSLDGHELVHNKNRQEFKKTYEWIRKINKVYSINAMLLATKNSIPYPKEAVRTYNELGLNKIWIKPVNNLGYASDTWNNIGISSEEFLKYWKTALSEVIKVNKKRPFMENHTNILLKKIITKDCVNFTDLESPCGAVIGQLAYSYDGKVYTCDEGRFFDIFNLGTVDEEYNKVVRKKQSVGIVKASINDNAVCEVCAYKPYCGVCPVCSYGETGNIITKLPNRRCRIYKGMFDHIFEKLLFDSDYRDVFHDWITNIKKYI